MLTTETVIDVIQRVGLVWAPPTTIVWYARAVYCFKTINALAPVMKDSSWKRDHARVVCTLAQNVLVEWIVLLVWMDYSCKAVNAEQLVLTGELITGLESAFWEALRRRFRATTYSLRKRGGSAKIVSNKSFQRRLLKWLTSIVIEIQTKTYFNWKSKLTKKEEKIETCSVESSSFFRYAGIS